MTRLEYFKSKVSYSKLLQHCKMCDYDIFVVNRWGDYCEYRVYGNSKENYYVIEK